MMDTGREDDSVSAIHHFFSAILGILLLVYVIWHHRKKNQLDEWSGKVSGSKDSEEHDFTRCQSSTCVTCHKDDHPAWKQRLQTYIETYASESCDLSTLQESLNSDVNGGDLKSELQKPTVYFLPTVKTSPWYEVEQFSGTIQYKDVCFLRHNFTTIKKDFANVYSAFVSGDKSGWIENRIQSGSWMVFHFYNQGEQIEDNCCRCPGTSSVLEALETLMSGISFGHACFSVLQPGSCITPHYGPCNLRVRCHLGLHIPEQSSLTVAGETRTWKEGDCLLFDDSFLHEASNMSAGPNTEEQTRTILMVDLWHPDLTDSEKEALRYTFSLEGCKE